MHLFEHQILHEKETEERRINHTCDRHLTIPLTVLALCRDTADDIHSQTHSTNDVQPHLYIHHDAILPCSEHSPIPDAVASTTHRSAGRRSEWQIRGSRRGVRRGDDDWYERGQERRCFLHTETSLGLRTVCTVFTFVLVSVAVSLAIATTTPPVKWGAPDAGIPF